MKPRKPNIRGPRMNARQTGMLRKAIAQREPADYIQRADQVEARVKELETEVKNLTWAGQQTDTLAALSSKLASETQRADRLQAEVEHWVKMNQDMAQELADQRTVIDKLREALKFYVVIYGNVGSSSVSRQTAKEMYEQANAALAAAEERKA